MGKRKERAGRASSPCTDFVVDRQAGTACKHPDCHALRSDVALSFGRELCHVRFIFGRPVSQNGYVHRLDSFRDQSASAARTFSRAASICPFAFQKRAPFALRNFAYTSFGSKPRSASWRLMVAAIPPTPLALFVPRTTWSSAVDVAYRLPSDGNYAWVRLTGGQ